MILAESKFLNVSVEEPTRLLLLDALRAEQFAPVIQTSRRRVFAQLLTAHAGGRPVEQEVKELERLLVAERREDDKGSYTPGDLFCSGDCVFYLTFDETMERGVRAGVVYDREAIEPLTRFELFCHRVREALLSLADGGDLVTAEDRELPQWEARGRPFPQGLARFIARVDADSVSAMRFIEAGRRRADAAGLLADTSVRALLRRAQEARLEGYSQSLMRNYREELGLLPVERLLEAGLLQREVRVTCRKTKHPLFDLPSPDALALITVSRAMCSHCATPVADEVVEEVFNPTRLALHLLSDGTWLRNRIYQIVRHLGVPESEIALGPSAAHGESYLIVNVCGEPFIFAVRDGDMSPSFIRHVTGTASEAEASHIVVVVTGAVEVEARMRLYEYAWRRSREGKDVEVAIVECVEGALGRIEGVFDKALLSVLARDLFALDGSLGMSASRFVLARFKVKRESRPDPAAGRHKLIHAA